MSAFSNLHANHVIEGDPMATAKVIADILQLTGDKREILFTPILHECENLNRNRIRSVEAAAGPIRSRSRSRSGRPVDRDARKALLVESFTVSTGVYVKWGAATIEQHQKRIDMLTRLSGGLSVTIARHQAAIDAITAAKVACLNDIEVAA